MAAHASACSQTSVWRLKKHSVIECVNRWMIVVRTVSTLALSLNCVGVNHQTYRLDLILSIYACSHLCQYSWNTSFFTYERDDQVEVAATWTSMNKLQRQESEWASMFDHWAKLLSGGSVSPVSTSSRFQSHIQPPGSSLSRSRIPGGLLVD